MPSSPRFKSTPCTTSPSCSCWASPSLAFSRIRIADCLANTIRGSAAQGQKSTGLKTHLPHLFSCETRSESTKFFWDSNSFSPRSLPSLPSVGPMFALSYNTSYCSGPQSPMRSRWRLPAGLGSLNKISVPVANQCYRLLHLLSAINTRISERTEEKRLERREGCIQWGLRQRPTTGRWCSGTGALRSWLESLSLPSPSTHR